MPDKTQLLDVIRKRASRTGIVTADRYFREVEGCFDGGNCPIASSGGTEDQWRKSLTEAESKLTYSNSEMVVLKKSFRKSAGDGILQFDAIVTTPRRDRDGDVLETKGAKLDKNCPLLWQHMHMQPIGKLVRTVKLTDAELVVRLAVANTALGRDAVELIKMGALRISHGFEPVEYKEMDDEEGYLFTQFNIFEISVVSIPSNTDAVILGVDGKSFATDMMRNWQKSHLSKIVIPDLACSCHKAKTEAEPRDLFSTLQTPQVEIEEAVAEANAPLELPTVAAVTEVPTVEPVESTPITKSFHEIERDYLSALVAADDVELLRRANGRLSTMLTSAEDQLEASAWDTLLSQVT